jgi:acyl-CoA synthetase (AMP-forming)/AMP-acid ligase II
MRTSLPKELAQRIEARTPARVTIGFGLTEHCPYITHTRADEPFELRALSAGRPLPNTEVKIVDPQGGATLPLDTVGEICARSYAVMQGYFDHPQATAYTLDAQGWLHTGDLGSLDAPGYLHVRGRLKDMIIRGGENIYPRVSGAVQDAASLALRRALSASTVGQDPEVCVVQAKATPLPLELLRQRLSVVAGTGSDASMTRAAAPSSRYRHGCSNPKRRVPSTRCHRCG